MGVRIVAFLLGVVVALLPARAFACGCCDAPRAMKVVGWSEDGQRALLDFNELVGCMEERRRVALRRGDQGGACSLKTLDPPEYACGKPIRGKEPSLSPADYPAPVRAVPAGFLRASVRVIGATTPSRRQVSVQVFAGGRWQALYSGRFLGWSPGEDDTPRLEYLEEIAALPTPDGKQALLTIARFDSMPGFGSGGVNLAWVDLPDSVGAAPGAPSVFETLPRHDVAKALPLDAPVVTGPGRLAIFEPGNVLDEHRGRLFPHNQQGLDAHRKGDFGTASRRFAEAVCADSMNPVPRYNLACSYARLNMPELAMAQLAIIAGQQKCPKCGERLARARTDEDLASLRDRADFRSLVCGDAGDCVGTPAVQPVVGAAPVASAPAVPSAPPVSTPSPPPSSCRCDVASRHAQNALPVVAVVAAVFRRRRRR